MTYWEIKDKFEAYFSVCEAVGETPEQVKVELMSDPAGTGEIYAEEEAQQIADVYADWIA